MAVDDLPCLSIMVSLSRPLRKALENKSVILNAKKKKKKKTRIIMNIGTSTPNSLDFASEQTDSQRTLLEEYMSK